MKHFIIGDLHGRDIWKKINVADYQKAIFPGDDVDSDLCSDKQILQNLKGINTFKKSASTDRVINGVTTMCSLSTTPNIFALVFALPCSGS